MLEGDDFLDEEVTNNVKRYEKMLRNKTNDYFDAEAYEGIIEFYIQKNRLKKALDAITNARNIYGSHTEFNIQLAEVYVLSERYFDAIDELEKIELYEPFNPEMLLLKGETLFKYGRF